MFTSRWIFGGPTPDRITLSEPTLAQETTTEVLDKLEMLLRVEAS